MIKEAIQYCVEKLSAQIETIADEPTAKWFMNRATGLPAQHVKDWHKRAHEFATLDGFIQFINHAAEPAMIFVGEPRVTADLRYGVHPNHKVTLNMKTSEEFNALRMMAKGLSVKDSWRVLNTSLWGAIDPALQLGLSNLEIRKYDEEDVSISQIGLGSSKGKSGIRISVKDAKAENGATTRDIAREWTWEGRIWECFPEKFQIGLILEIANDEKEIRIHIHPQRIETVVDTAKQSLVTHLRSSLTNANVFEGAL